jgi:hypothetical protein
MLDGLIIYFKDSSCKGILFYALTLKRFKNQEYSYYTL